MEVQKKLQSQYQDSSKADLFAMTWILWPCHNGAQKGAYNERVYARVLTIHERPSLPMVLMESHCPPLFGMLNLHWPIEQNFWQEGLISSSKLDPISRRLLPQMHWRTGGDRLLVRSPDDLGNLGKNWNVSNIEIFLAPLAPSHHPQTAHHPHEDRKSKSLHGDKKITNRKETGLFAHGFATIRNVGHCRDCSKDSLAALARVCRRWLWV